MSNSGLDRGTASAGHGLALPRRVSTSELWGTPSPSGGGRAERRTPDASAASCAMKASARVSHHESTGQIRRSARGGFFGLLRALPGNGRSLTPSSPRYFRLPVGARKSSPDFGKDHTTWAGAPGRCRWGESPPRPAPRSVVVRRTPWPLTRLRRPDAPSGRGAHPSAGLAPCDPWSGPTLPRPPHPAPRIVTIAIRPSHRGGIM